MLGPAVLSGASFPLAIRLVLDEPGAAGDPVDRGIDDPAGVEQLRRVLGFLEGDAFVGLGHLGESFPIGLAAHGQVHANFGTFAHEVVFETLDNFRIHILARTDHMGISPDQITFLDGKFGFYSPALGAGFRCIVTFMGIAAN